MKHVAALNVQKHPVLERELEWVLRRMAGKDGGEVVVGDRGSGDGAREKQAAKGEEEALEIGEELLNELGQVWRDQHLVYGVERGNAGKDDYWKKQ